MTNASPEPNADFVPHSQEEVDNLQPTTPWPDHEATSLEQNVYETGYKLARQMLEIRRLQYEKDHDPLTGLLTKKAWLAQANEELAHADPNDVYVALFIDLDRFKSVNDRHPGQHGEGDMVLKDVAFLLSRSVRHQESHPDLVVRGNKTDEDVARLGGDEFAVFAKLEARDNPSLSAEERLTAFQTRLQENFDEYLAVRPDLAALGLGLSVGAVLAQPGQTAEELLAQSDNAMYIDKEAGRDPNEPRR